MYSRVGVALPRTTSAQYGAMQHVSKAQMRPGDVLFVPGSSGGIEHKGIYAGANSWWVARHTGTVITRQTLYTSNYLVGRVTGSAAGAVATQAASTAAAVSQPLLRVGSQLHPDDVLALRPAHRHAQGVGVVQPTLRAPVRPPVPVPEGLLRRRP